MAVPKSTIPSENEARLFSPANQAATPPSLGIVLAISAKALPAVVAALTDSTFMPVTLSEKDLIATPNAIIPSENEARLFSPANQATIPPSLGIVLAISASALPAVAEAVTTAGSIPATLVA